VFTLSRRNDSFSRGLGTRSHSGANPACSRCGIACQRDKGNSCRVIGSVPFLVREKIPAVFRRRSPSSGHGNTPAPTVLNQPVPFSDRAVLTSRNSPLGASTRLSGRGQSGSPTHQRPQHQGWTCRNSAWLGALSSFLKLRDGCFPPLEDVLQGECVRLDGRRTPCGSAAGLIRGTRPRRSPAEWRRTSRMH
jgi:hypothetical protein